MIDPLINLLGDLYLFGDFFMFIFCLIPLNFNPVTGVLTFSFSSLVVSFPFEIIEEDPYKKDILLCFMFEILLLFSDDFSLKILANILLD